MNEWMQDGGRKGLDGQGRLFAARLATGLIQGGALYLLYRAAEVGMWPDTRPEVFGGLALAFGYAPAVLLAAVGRLKPLPLALWTAAAATALFLMGWHDVARRVTPENDQAPYLEVPVLAFSAAALFVAHHLILPAIRERRWRADYHAYFDVAWKAGVQLALSLGFTLAFWLLLQLGAALFHVIGVKALSSLIGEAWFAIPVTCLAFALGVQLTDVRDGLIRGVRTVALMLLSWLLPVIALLTAGFLAALPFTGLERLWDTGSATALVLAAAAALIILINTAYQDGRPDNLPPAALRIATRIAGGLVAPLVGLAFWGLALRIGQHGLTPDRIIALACAVVGAVYAGGYLVAAVRPGGWMRPLETTNVAAGVLAVAAVLALFSPLLDPARLSVADQVARLERGAVRPEAFDYDFLRFDSGKAGLAALDRLARSSDAKTAELARQAKARDARQSLTAPERQARAAGIQIQPVPGQTTPPSFAAQLFRQDNLMYACAADTPCRLRNLDLDGDGRPEVLLATSSAVLTFSQNTDGQWVQTATYVVACAPGTPEELAKGFAERFAVAPAGLPDLIVGGRRLQAQPEIRCPPPAPR
ncbi:DUF4153 domain-containing protein [Brevundimonas aurantiaca]|uniref:DUF4153 domain-containing protein n=1 Tax=Brevundimonas aurantiaca TaxID=74316 RepID=UPI00191B2A5D|nr:DUF4153 domain-containing protein [Brevundimonas aurantiaca]KAK0346729.1 hypothetical protein LTR94_005407 [Friedmanniomyces endolithicus]